MDFENESKEEKREGINRSVALKGAVEMMKCVKKGSFKSADVGLDYFFMHCLWLLQCNARELPETWEEIKKVAFEKHQDEVIA